MPPDPVAPAPKTAEPVRTAKLVDLAANAVVAAFVAWLADHGLNLDALWTIVLTGAAVGVFNFVLGALLWGWGRLSEKIPWRTVRDQVVPIPLVDPDFAALHHDEPQV
jgi:ABC-type sulfate transport system permease component